MSRQKQAAVFAEMQKIRSRHKGILRPENVLSYAKNPRTALHEKFEWDDAKAGYEYRLWQAREMIAVFVTVVKPNTSPVRTFVSLRTDRMFPGGGYRALVDVMTDAALRKQLLAEALDDAERWQAKYALLSELTPVFQELAKLKAKQVKKDAA